MSLTAAFCCHHQDDLLSRLRSVAGVLADGTSIGPSAEETESLAEMSKLLLSHKGKRVSLYRALVCLEIFAVHATKSTSHEDVLLGSFREELWAAAYSLDNSEEDSSADPTVTAQLFDDVVPILLRFMRHHPVTEATGCLEKAVWMVLNEYGISTPVSFGLLDELLLCIGRGRRVPGADAATSTEQGNLANQSYKVAQSILQKYLERLATPLIERWHSLITMCESREQDRSSTEAVEATYAILDELCGAAPKLIPQAIGGAYIKLQSRNVEERAHCVDVLGHLFAVPGLTMADANVRVFFAWAGLIHYSEPKICRFLARHAGALLRGHPGSSYQSLVITSLQVLSRDPATVFHKQVMHEIAECVKQP